MGIDIEVIDENGTDINILLDPNALTKELLPPVSDNSSSCLRFIDPYGDTIFNQYQIPVLISEIERRLYGETKPEIRRHGNKIIELANQALSQVHLYLKFFGD